MNIEEIQDREWKSTAKGKLYVVVTRINSQANNLQKKKTGKLSANFKKSNSVVIQSLKVQHHRNVCSRGRAMSQQCS